MTGSRTSRPAVAGIVAAAIVCALGACASHAPPATGEPRAAKSKPEPEPEPIPELRDFRARADGYVKLARGIAPPPAKGAKGEMSAPALEARHVTGAAAIREARTGAKIGDILPPPAAVIVCERVRQVLREPLGPSTRAAIQEEAEPRKVALEVNADYGADAVSTMPPFLLAALPRLPSPLEYRVVGRTLVLRDADANLVVDLARDCLPAAAPSKAAAPGAPAPAKGKGK